MINTDKIKALLSSLSKQRFLVQIFFSLICIWIGVEFHYFVKFLEKENVILSYRQPGGETFLAEN